MTAAAMANRHPFSAIWPDDQMARYEKRMASTYRLEGRVEQALRSAGFRGYPDDGIFDVPGFSASPSVPIYGENPVDFVKVQHIDLEEVDTRPFVAQYAAAIESAGLRCDVVEEQDHKDGTLFPFVYVYPDKE